jgi:polysaccharide deacetylase 2 family uncharacterized protein YibQ
MPVRLLVRSSFVILLIFASWSCTETRRPQRLSESDRRKLAARIQSVVAEAGGAQVWIKRPARISHVPPKAVQVVATPAAYKLVLARVQGEAHHDHLELSASSSNAAGGLHSTHVRVQQGGQEIIHLHLREVPRLLHAAIVMDDLGRDLEAVHKLLALDYPLTFSVLPYLNHSAATAEEAHRRGREVMLHLPMEPEPSAHVSPGKGAVLVGMDGTVVKRVVDDDLAAVPYAVGVNNHMGSRATRDAALMARLMKILAAHRLYFIDSRTTAATAALDAARRQGVPSFYRAVFLDDTETTSYTLGQLAKFRHTVEENGVALAIGHPHPTTIAALAQFLPELERADIELVPPSEIVGLPELARLHPPGTTH